MSGRSAAQQVGECAELVAAILGHNAVIVDGDWVPSTGIPRSQQEMGRACRVSRLWQQEARPLMWAEIEHETGTDEQAGLWQAIMSTTNGEDHTMVLRCSLALPLPASFADADTVLPEMSAGAVVLWLLSRFPRLQRLELECSNLSVDERQFFFAPDPHGRVPRMSSVMQHLTQFEITECRVSALFTLLNCMPALQELSVGGLSMEPDEPQPALVQMSCLKRLDLEPEEEEELSDWPLIIFKQLLLACAAQLEHLRFRWCNANSMRNALATQPLPSLRTLDLEPQPPEYTDDWVRAWLRWPSTCSTPADQLDLRLDGYRYSFSEELVADLCAMRPPLQKLVIHARLHEEPNYANSSEAHIIEHERYDREERENMLDRARQLRALGMQVDVFDTSAGAPHDF